MIKRKLFYFVLLSLCFTSYGQEVIEGITYESYNNAKNTYNYTYWNSNFKTEGEAIRKFTNQTSSYNLSINYTKLSIASLNINSQGTTPGEALQESNAATFTSLQPGNINFKILKEGAVIHEKNASKPTNLGNKITQMANYGTWCNRRVIDSLNFTNNAQVHGSYTGIEFTNWHNRFRITFQLKLREAILEGQMQLSVEMPDAFSDIYYSDGIYGFATDAEGEGFSVKGGITAASTQVCGNTITVTTSAATLKEGTQYELSLIFYAVKDNFCARFANTVDDAQEVAITASQTLPDNTSSAKVFYSHDEGVYYIDIPSYNMGSNNESNIDVMQNIDLEIKNSHSKNKRVRLCFLDDSHKNVVGFSSMLRNPNGDPSGIPLQISKNWHNGTPMLYSANPSSYSKEYTELIIPANTTLKFDYTRVGARWGNVFAASSHQLSVVGAGVPRGGWLEAALGSFGESITHSPDYEYGGTNVCDYRPFLVTNQYYGLSSKEYSWTGNLGGMDLFRYDNGSGSRIYQSQVKTRFNKYGPNLTETTISTFSSDETLKMEYTFFLNRSDDYLRVYYKVKVKALKNTSFSRFDIFQLGSDNYNLLKAQSLVYGDSSGVVGQFTPTNSGVNDYTTGHIALTGTNPWIWAGDGIMTRGLEGINIDGNNSLIIRSYHASFDGVPNNTPYFRERVSSEGYSASTGHNPTSYCIVPPEEITSFTAGDSIELLVEVCLFPKVADVYYGPNVNFKNALTRYGNSWEIVFREALGNTIKASSTTNVVHEEYPLTVEAIDNKAEVTVTGGLGYIPIVFSGITNITDPKLWQLNETGQVLIDQSNYGKDFWQAEYNVETGLYDIIYNVNHDLIGDSTATYTYLFETLPSGGPNSAEPEEDSLSECSASSSINTTVVCHTSIAVISENIALNGAATQSSTDYDGEASRAIDGNTNGTYNGQSVTHTTSETNPWWQVDLGGEYSIEEIKIFNRTDDCCMDRLSSFTVSVIDSSGTITFSQSFTSYPNPSITVEANGARGSIIKVQLDAGSVLSLAEVEVFEALSLISFKVIDDSTKVNLQDVLLTINNQEYATNDRGEVPVALANGLYNYMLSKDGYHSFSQSLNLAADTILVVHLKSKDLYALDFLVKDSASNQNIAAVSIAINDTVYETDELGEVSLDLWEGVYTYVLTKDGYETIDGSLELSKDDSITIAMLKELVSLSMKVVDESLASPLSGVDVSLNNESKQTGTNGEVLFTDLEMNTSYSYELFKAGYETIDGSLELSKDDSITIAMVAIISGTNENLDKTIKIYPNPATDFLEIESPLCIKKIRVYNKIGQLKSTFEPDSYRFKLNTQDFEIGVYILNLELENHTHVQYRFGVTK